MNPLMQVKNLSISYRTSKGISMVVKNATFTIFKGDIVGLVGESGAGKTTLALSLIDLLPENASKNTGKVIFKGNDITHMSPQEALEIRGKEIGLCLQDALASLNPVLSIGYQLIEVIKYKLNMPAPKAREHALKLLRDFNINDPEKVLNLYPHELSGGMRQRVLLIMTVACKPKLIILDEPTSSLDALTENSIIDFIIGIKKEFHLAILLISHNGSLINRICSRILVLKEGVLSEK